MRHTALLVLIACSLAGFACQTGDAPDTSAEAVDHEAEALAAGRVAMAAINAETLRGPIVVMSDDSFGGRGPSSEGDRMTQAYLTEQMQAIGLKPGGSDGEWLQPFEIVGVNSAAPETWTFLGPTSGVNLTYYEEAVPFSGTQNETSTLDSAELVFVGYGIRAPEYDWDDFGDADLTGKVLVIMNNDPDWDDELFAGNRRLWYGRWDYKYEMAARVGAAGAIVIHTTPSAGYPFQVVQTSNTGENFELPTEGEPRVEVKAWVTEDAARRLVALSGHDLDALRESARSRDFEPVPLNVVTSLTLDNTIRRAQTANVLGLIEGSDPELGRELVVYSAHHDHLGIGTPNADGDEIYNGALDNASGCSQMLAIAKAFTESAVAPRRSILFAFVAAEESGLLGSEYYARHPTVAPGLLAANINLDGANIWGRSTDVSYIGHGKTSLDPLVESLAAEQGRVVKPDQHPDKGYFYRSDQFNFAKIGVPAAYLDSGTEFVDRPEGWGLEQMEEYNLVNYHQPSDELTDDWSFEGMVEDAQLSFLLGVQVAAADEGPTWNAGDEFEAARLEALAALDQ